jgi:ubiquitin-activating enzyme E1 C
LDVDPNLTLQEFIESLAARPEAQLKKPSIRSEEHTLYMHSPESLRLKTAPNLGKKIGELVVNGEEIGVSDPSLGMVNFKFKLNFSKNFANEKVHGSE